MPNNVITSGPAVPAGPTAGSLTTRTPWLYIGLSRSGFYRLLDAGEAPQPLRLPGVRPVWRFSDLDRWIRSLRPARRSPRRKQAEGGDEGGGSVA
jgi:predicted DNA-binding transcriptional regulator AlpA